jgi:hypothetical protein
LVGVAAVAVEKEVLHCCSVHLGRLSCSVSSVRCNEKGQVDDDAADERSCYYFGKKKLSKVKYVE